MRVLLAFIVLMIHLGPKEKDLIVNEKTISVTGNTSLGGFTCDYCDKSIGDTLVINGVQKNGDLIFDILVKEFSCGNFILNKDFRKTIKAEHYPYARIRVSNLKSRGMHYTCDLSVDLAGKKLEFKALALQNKNRELKADLILSFDQLELEAPKKMGGLIKVDESLALEIKLGY
ncbi:MULTISPECIES: hypothetical protein [Rhodonellum]|nr:MULTISPECIES: hypothetical protein [Rhodonellum]MDO9553044.1 hypothetical protein [Rhodonellum sp.]SDZ36339.1 hypothetical protein SAMN05444412_11199 [Rhodonellum ikkaensis]